MCKGHAEVIFILKFSITLFQEGRWFRCNTSILEPGFLSSSITFLKWKFLVVMSIILCVCKRRGEAEMREVPKAYFWHPFSLQCKESVFEILYILCLSRPRREKDSQGSRYESTKKPFSELLITPEHIKSETRCPHGSQQTGTSSKENHCLLCGGGWGSSGLGEGKSCLM